MLTGVKRRILDELENQVSVSATALESGLQAMLLLNNINIIKQYLGYYMTNKVMLLFIQFGLSFGLGLAPPRSWS